MYILALHLQYQLRCEKLLALTNVFLDYFTLKIQLNFKFGLVERIGSLHRTRESVATILYQVSEKCGSDWKSQLSEGSFFYRRQAS